MLEGANQAKIIYGLYLAGFVVPITPLVGVVMAYLAQGEADAWLASHYRFQIRTFWIGLLYSTVSALLVVVLIGIPALILAAVWFIVRCVKGFQALDRSEPVADVETWMF